MGSIEFKGVTKRFGENTVIGDLDLTIEDGSFTVLVGPSGCGKTTLLRMIAGLDTQTAGQLLIDGKDVSHARPGDRDIAMVFQNYAIYPTMSVRGNIEFGLKNNKVSRDERRQLVESISKTVGLSDYLDRKPSTLSGGQRQRVALARAMVKKPGVFLMDEPLSNLDAKLRFQMRVELIELHKMLGTTFVYVTHDQGEAMSMADTIVLMNGGKIQQMAPPEVMYRQPANVFTAEFMGIPPMNVTRAGADGIRLGFRPENARLSYAPIDGAFTAQGRVVTREMLGSETVYQVRGGDDVFMVKSTDPGIDVDREVHLAVGEEHLVRFGADGVRIDAPVAEARPAHA
ncbi:MULTISPECIES: ABC transporter ATP-binding protein [Microbacterium]|uniref:ABC transporter ATP-binding protein n=1 Tax=Microbacterium wangchenii TaxID=2541726 RepID=A0ABX5SRE4_9MICO|nr:MULTISPECIES: ABC transporter ATP-binding protein [Microbacterium]MCK6065261.1 ABC transporter ATP-binding protein [Microbacterium sp. EYE_512]QBR88710.1 ABC transporter ATP-binding protein [Microbacterium wangchenii]